MSLHPQEIADAPRAQAPGVRSGLVFTALTYGVSAIGALTVRGRARASSSWFRTLKKPSFQPPSWVFAPVWMVLHGSIAASGWRIWRSPPSLERTRALVLWAKQLLLNGAWTPLFFGAHKPTAALADLMALDVAAGKYAVGAAKVDRTAAMLVAPYLAWLGLATALNAAIVARSS